MPADTDHHTAFIAGLRQLATFLEANPEVPVPRHSTSIAYFPERTADAEMCAEIDRITALCGSKIDPGSLTHDHYGTTLCFGPIRYEAFAVLANARARHDAFVSYQGCITPDTKTEPPPVIHYRCCTCNGTGVNGDNQTCPDCDGIGIDLGA
ncbi:hypothetical protein [Sphaerisporangium aureirubrum]|uniref:hypothetical protein n=1 Tax=Sphaerisporangium aureirubrum TaxID=1544736 RepID=UPI00362E2A46